MICLRDDMDQKDDKLIGLLNTVFSSEKSKEEIKEELSGQYGIPMEDGFEKEVDLMWNLSEMYEERGMKRGMKGGMERGMERGMEIGELVGKIMMCKEFGFSDEETAKKLNISVKTLRETLKKRDLQLQR